MPTDRWSVGVKASYANGLQQLGAETAGPAVFYFYCHLGQYSRRRSAANLPISAGASVGLSPRFEQFLTRLSLLRHCCR